MGAGDKKGPNPSSQAKSAADDKAQRRAEALRANLKRRKVQQRDRADTGKTATDGE
nr:hypothetical protein [uncultured Dongia sp.]